MQDNLSNLLISIQNGSRARRLSILVPNSKFSRNILKVLSKEGYLRGFSIDLNNLNKIKVYLKYYNNKPVVQKVLRVSKPGIRIYSSVRDLSKYLFPRQSLVLISTSKGLISHKDAMKYKLGGEVLFKIY